MATRNLTRSLLTTTTSILSRSSSSVLPNRLRPLIAAATSFSSRLSPAFSARSFATRQTSSSLNDPNPNWSTRPPKETILLDGCDFEHWLVVLEKPEGDPTRDEIIDSYIKTLAMVVGSEEEARMKIYSVSTRHYYAFGALVSEELSFKLKELPKVRWVLPDSYLDVRNKDYGGEPFIDGRAVPYDPKYHEEWVRNNARANERNRRNDRPRNFDRSRNFERRREGPNQAGPYQGSNQGGPPPMNAGPVQPNMGGQQNFAPQNNYQGNNNMRGPPPNNAAPNPQYGNGPNNAGPYQSGPGPNPVGFAPTGGPPQGQNQPGYAPPNTSGVPYQNQNAPGRDYPPSPNPGPNSFNQNRASGPGPAPNSFAPNAGYGTGPQQNNYAPNMGPPSPGPNQTGYPPHMGQNQNGYAPPNVGGNPYQNQNNIPERDLPQRSNY